MIRRCFAAPPLANKHNGDGFVESVPELRPTDNVSKHLLLHISNVPLMMVALVAQDKLVARLVSVSSCLLLALIGYLVVLAAATSTAADLVSGCDHRRTRHGPGICGAEDKPQ